MTRTARGGQEAVSRWLTLPLPLLLLAVLVFRYLCHSLMLVPVLWNELQPAPVLPDLILSRVPLVPFLLRWNYFFWLACYVPPALLLLRRDRRIFIRFILIDGAIALLRGLLIPLTTFGPPVGADLNGLHPFDPWRVWLDLINPLRALYGNTAGIYLTKDLFFSGHVATTFLLWLFWRRLGRTGHIVLGLHLVTVAIVFLSHLHYSVDVVGAYFVTFTLFVLGEKLLLRHWPELFEKS